MDSTSHSAKDRDRGNQYKIALLTLALFPYATIRLGKHQCPDLHALSCWKLSVFPQTECCVRTPWSARQPRISMVIRWTSDLSHLRPQNRVSWIWLPLPFPVWIRNAIYTVDCASKNTFRQNNHDVWSQQLQGRSFGLFERRRVPTASSRLFSVVARHWLGIRRTRECNRLYVELTWLCETCLSRDLCSHVGGDGLVYQWRSHPFDLHTDYRLLFWRRRSLWNDVPIWG